MNKIRFFHTVTTRYCWLSTSIFFILSQVQKRYMTTFWIIFPKTLTWEVLLAQMFIVLAQWCRRHVQFGLTGRNIKCSFWSSFYLLHLPTPYFPPLFMSEFIKVEGAVSAVVVPGDWCFCFGGCKTRVCWESTSKSSRGCNWQACLSPTTPK